MQNSGQLLLAVVIGLGVGGLLGAQPSINGSLGKVVDKPISAALISFLVGTSTLAVLATILGGLLPRFTTPVAELPWWIWLGGGIGVVVVFSSLVFVPKVGSLPWFAALMTGQVMAAILLDHFGLLGNRQSPASPLKIAGAVCLVMGVLLIVLAKRAETNRPTIATTESADSPSIEP